MKGSKVGSARRTDARLSRLRTGEPAPGSCVDVIMAKPLAKTSMISIIDDDKSVREAAKTLIRSLGFTAETFASAEEFLESGRLCDTACLITDVQMPGMSGVDLQCHLAKNGHRTPVILVTAHPEEHIRARALDAGAFGVLSKPFNEESLIACLDRALAHTHHSANLM